jgi:hypothetical protein
MFLVVMYTVVYRLNSWMLAALRLVYVVHSGKIFLLNQLQQFETISETFSSSGNDDGGRGCLQNVIHLLQTSATDRLRRFYHL